MDGLRDPVGGKSPEIYWRRRIVAAIGVVLVIVVIYFLASSPGGKKSDASPSVTPEVTTSANPSTDPSAPASGDVSRPCTAADVALTITPNPQAFPGGALPVFDVAVKQSGPTPCLLDTAATGTELKVTSGSDRVFSSLDCPSDGTITARQFLLDAGASDNFQVTWNRKRSVPECTTVEAAPRPGTYHAILTVQGIASNDATFSLTD
ncbi:MAG: hypothetical protein HGA51_11355 [Demequinaceae bacterium]|nr:hypothetical protein [Demequinaceae bacterium]